jgi:hypothetical protein
MSDQSAEAKVGVPEHKRDACKYSTDLSKQFLTLTTAGLAFLIASYFAGNLEVSILTLYLCFGLFGLSAILGFLFLMSVIGNIDQLNRYDVYTARHRGLVGVQIGAFAIAVLVLAIATLQSAAESSLTRSDSHAILTVTSHGVTLRHELMPGSSVSTVVDSAGQLLVTVAPTAAANTDE